MLRRLLPFADNLWGHRELLWQFTRRNFELTLRGSHLGLIWSFLNPLLMLGLYVFVFGFIFGGHFGVVANETPTEYALGIFLGLTIFGLIAEIIAMAPMIITSNPNFVKKVVFPLEVLPAAAVGASIGRMLIGLAFALLGIILLGPGWHPALLWLPVIILPVILGCLGLAWLISSLGVFIQDISQLMAFLVQVVMYSSAVFYSAARIQEKAPIAWPVLRFNPVLQAIELSRNTALWHQAIDFRQLGYLYAFGLLICYLGHFVFRRLRPAFADVL
jgi:lipopolysaccharide transport system permease protein